MLTKFIYMSVGTAAVSIEKFKELLEDLIQNDAFIEDEGKRIVDALLHDMRENIDHYRQNAQFKWDDFLETNGFAKIKHAKSDMEHFVKDVKENPFALLTRWEKES